MCFFQFRKPHLALFSCLYHLYWVLTFGPEIGLLWKQMNYEWASSHVCVPSLGKWKEFILSGLGCRVITYPRWIQVYMWGRSILISCLKHSKMLKSHWTDTDRACHAGFPRAGWGFINYRGGAWCSVVRSCCFILVNRSRKEVQSVWPWEPIWFSTSSFNSKSFIFFTPPFIYSVDLYSQITEIVMGRIFHYWNQVKFTL